MTSRNKTQKIKKTVKDAPEFKVAFQKRMMIKDPKYPDQSYYVTRYEGNFTRDEIRAFAQRKSNELFKLSPKSALFGVSIKFDGIFKSGKRTAPGAPISIWDESDSNNEQDVGEIEGFDILTTIPRNIKLPEAANVKKQKIKFQK